MSQPDDEQQGGGGAYVIASLTKLGGDQVETASRVARVEDRVEDLAAALDAIEAAAGSLDDPTAADPGEPGTGGRGVAPDQHGGDAFDEGLDMRALVGWVRGNVAQLVERKLPQTGQPPHWCRRWWMHPEAIARFEAVRRSWAEAVTSEGNAMVVYFEHLDHHLGVLMGAGGPFTSCTAGEHKPGSGVAALGQDEPDEAYYTEFEQLTEADSQ